MFYVLLYVTYVHSSIAIILMGKRELVVLLNLSSWCLVMVERIYLAVPWGCLRFVIVVFPDHTHLLFLKISGMLIIFLNNFINKCCCFFTLLWIEIEIKPYGKASICPTCYIIHPSNY